MPLDLTASAADITRAICDIPPSESGSEAHLADLIEEAICDLGHLEVIREGNTIVARTNLGRAQRVAIAGHIDTVPINGNVPTRDVEIDGEPMIWGPRDGRHEGRGGGGAAQARRRAHGARGGHHLDVVRQRGGRGRAQR